MTEGGGEDEQLDVGLSYGILFPPNSDKPVWSGVDVTQLVVHALAPGAVLSARDRRGSPPTRELSADKHDALLVRVRGVLTCLVEAREAHIASSIGRFPEAPKLRMLDEQEVKEWKPIPQSYLPPGTKLAQMKPGSVSVPDILGLYVVCPWRAEAKGLGILGDRALRDVQGHKYAPFVRIVHYETLVKMLSHWLPKCFDGDLGGDSYTPHVHPRRILSLLEAISHHRPTRKFDLPKDDESLSLLQEVHNEAIVSELVRGKTFPFHGDEVDLVIRGFAKEDEDEARERMKGESFMSLLHIRTSTNDKQKGAFEALLTSPLNPESELDKIVNPDKMMTKEDCIADQVAVRVGLLMNQLSQAIEGTCASASDSDAAQEKIYRTCYLSDELVAQFKEYIDELTGSSSEDKIEGLETREETRASKLPHGLAPNSTYGEESAIPYLVHLVKEKLNMQILLKPPAPGSEEFRETSFVDELIRRVILCYHNIRMTPTHTDKYRGENLTKHAYDSLRLMMCELLVRGFCGKDGCWEDFCFTGDTFARESTFEKRSLSAGRIKPDLTVSVGKGEPPKQTVPDDLDFLGLHDTEWITVLLGEDKEKLKEGETSADLGQLLYMAHSILRRLLPRIPRAFAKYFRLPLLQFAGTKCRILLMGVQADYLSTIIVPNYYPVEFLVPPIPKMSDDGCWMDLVDNYCFISCAILTTLRESLALLYCTQATTQLTTKPLRSVSSKAKPKEPKLLRILKKRKNTIRKNAKLKKDRRVVELKNVKTVPNHKFVAFASDEGGAKLVVKLISEEGREYDVVGEIWTLNEPEKSLFVKMEEFVCCGKLLYVMPRYAPCETNLKTEKSVVQLAWDVARALKALHGKGYLHLDIKGDNVYWDKTTTHFRVGDIELAREFGEVEEVEEAEEAEEADGEDVAVNANVDVEGEGESEDGLQEGAPTFFFGGTPGFSPEEQECSWVLKFNETTDYYAFGKMIEEFLPPALSGLEKPGEKIYQTLNRRVRDITAAFSVDSQDRRREAFNRLYKSLEQHYLREPEKMDTGDDDATGGAPGQQGGNDGNDSDDKTKPSEKKKTGSADAQTSVSEGVTTVKMAANPLRPVVFRAPTGPEEFRSLVSLLHWHEQLEPEFVEACVLGLIQMAKKEFFQLFWLNVNLMVEVKDEFLLRLLRNEWNDGLLMKNVRGWWDRYCDLVGAAEGSEELAKYPVDKRLRVVLNDDDEDDEGYLAVLQEEGADREMSWNRTLRKRRRVGDA